VIYGLAFLFILRDLAKTYNPDKTRVKLAKPLT
jgi:hypothetical protein